MNSQLVLAEGFTNVVRHAHINLPPSTPIHIQVILFKKYLVIRIWDHGPPFNLESKLRSVSLDDPLIQEGGRGLKWIKMLTDQTHYIRTPDGRNCLVMLTKIN